MNSLFSLSGRYELKVTRDGKVVHRDKGRNLVTRVGENHAAARFGKSAPPTAVDWIALGDGTIQPQKTDTGLGNEHAGTRTAATSDVTSANTCSYLFSFTAAGTLTVTECGVFSHATLDIMSARFLTQEFTMYTGDVLDITWALTFEGID